MPRCFALIRSAVHSWSGRRPSLILPPAPPPQWHATRSFQQNYTITFAEPRRDDTHDARPYPEDDYLDFVLGNDGEAPSGSSPTPEAHNVKPSLSGRARNVSKPVRTRYMNTRVSQAAGTRKLVLTQAQRAQIKARRSSLHRDKNVRPAKPSMRSELRTSAVFSSVWNLRYTFLARRYDRRLPEHYLQPPDAITINSETFDRIEEVLDSLDKLPDAWRGSELPLKDLAQRHGKLEREIWSETALWLMCYHRVQLMYFLRATHAPLYPPINWVEDCLQALARHYGLMHYDEEIRAKRFRQLVSTFLFLLDRKTKEQFVFAGGFVRLLLPHCTDAQADEIWTSIKLGKVKVHFNTILHFAEYFNKRDQLERSLDALLEAHRAGAAPSSVAFRSGCSTLLRKSSSHPGGFRMRLRLVEHLAGLGVHLDTRLYNIIMLNAVEAGDLETLGNLYHSMLQQGLMPDKYTCAIRLKACKLDIDNAEMLQDVIQDAIKYGDVRTEQLVSGEVLHCLALHHRKHSPDTAFRTLAAAYRQFFETGPLERLGLQFPIEKPSNGLDDKQTKRMQPPRHAITIMLSAYLDTQASRTEAHDMYIRWRAIVESGDDPALVSCATTPHLSNAFLFRFTRSRNSLLLAAQVVKDMQKPLPITSGVRQAQPDLATWSIFMQGFVRTRQNKMAEQVLSYMRSKGLEPDRVTWESLARGYAEQQDEEGLLDVVRRAEAGGVVFDDWAQRAGTRLRDSKRLRELLERQRLERSLDFTGELKGKLEGRLGGAGDGDGAGEVERLGSVLREEDARERGTNAKGFADSSAELAELAGGVT